jgi:hypothetical protein
MIWCCESFEKHSSNTAGDGFRVVYSYHEPPRPDANALPSNAALATKMETKAALASFSFATVLGAERNYQPSRAPD